MSPLALLLLGQATLVAVRPQSEVACPTPAQVNLAIGARIPGLLVPADRATSTGALVLLELAPGEGGATDLRLVGADGTPHLRRVLANKEGPEDCSALAETVALIVERFVVEVDDRGAREAAAAAAAPARRWDLSVAAGWRSGAETDGGLQALLRVDRLLGRRFQVSLSAGLGANADAVPARSSYYGQASVRRLPVELGLWWLRALEPGELQLGVTGGLEITRVSSRWDTAHRDDTFPGPVASLAAALRFPVGDYAFFRLTSSFGAALVRYDFYFSEDPGLSRRTVFTAPTQRFYAKIAAELGIALPLMKKRPPGP